MKFINYYMYIFSALLNKYTRFRLLSSVKPVIGDKRTRMLDGTVGVRNGPATVGVIVETKSMPFSFAN